MYYLAVTDTPQVAVSDARKEIGKLVDAAHYAGHHTILAKNEEPRAVLVPYRWYIEHRDRTD
jgi:antitoxin (DNA-binding transcriptional repressor) of toxin-antitoxin stability system